MATEIKSKKGLLKAYACTAQRVQLHFEHLPALLAEFPLTVSLAYAFAQLELAQNMALYCGVVKLHRANSELARHAVSSHHMTREGFVELYETVFGIELPAAAAAALKTAEDTRDEVMHGKSPTEARLRNAVARVLEYGEAMNVQLKKHCGLEPFGQLRGFAGRARKLDKRTTRFMLKGMGFGLS